MSRKRGLAARRQIGARGAVWAGALAWVCAAALVAGCGDDGGGAAAPAPCPDGCAVGQACVNDACVDIATGGGATGGADAGEDEDAAGDAGEDADTGSPDAADAAPDAPQPARCTRDSACLEVGTYCDLLTETCQPGCREGACGAGATCNLTTRRCQGIPDYCDSDARGDACGDGDTCCPLGSVCDTDAEVCLDGCFAQRDCPLNLPCFGAANGAPGQCGCSSDAQCAGGQVCAAGRCEAVTCAPDAFEPNDDPLGATPLDVAATEDAPGSVAPLEACPDDADMFVVDLLPGAVIAGSVQATDPGDASDALRWTWQSPSGARLDRDDGAEPFAITTDEAGPHLLIVEAPRAQTPLPYTLTYSFDLSAVDCDPDGLADVALDLDAEERAMVSAQSICPDTVDRFTLRMAQPGLNLTARLRRLDGVFGTSARVAIVGAGGEALGASSGAGLQVEASAVAGSEAVVEVSLEPDGATPVGARYTLELITSPGPPDGPCVDDDAEDNDTREAATPLTAPTRGGLVVCEDDASGGDWYALALRAGEAAIARVLYAGDAAPAATLWLGDGPDAVSVPLTATTCANNAPCLRSDAIAADADATWLLQVTAPDGARVPYGLSVTQAAACDPRLGRWEAGCLCTPDPWDAPFVDEARLRPLPMPGFANGEQATLASRTLCFGDEADAVVVWTPPGADGRLTLEQTGGAGGDGLELAVFDDLGQPVGVVGPDAPLALEGSDSRARQWTVQVARDGLGDVGYRLRGALVGRGGALECLSDALEPFEPEVDLGTAYGSHTLHAGPLALCGDDLDDRFTFSTWRDGDRLAVTLRPLWGLDDAVTLRLIDLDGQTELAFGGVASWDDRDLDAGGAGWVVDDLPAGRYVVRVGDRSAPGALGRGYRLEATLAPASPECVDEPSEPNDLPEVAGDLDGPRQLGALCGPDDLDRYVANIAGGGLLWLQAVVEEGARATLTPPGGGGGAPEPVASAAPCGAGLQCLTWGPRQLAVAEGGSWRLTVERASAEGAPLYALLTCADGVCRPDFDAEACVAPSPAADSPDAPFELVVGAVPTTVGPRPLCGAQSVDWLRLSGVAGSRVTFDAEVSGEGGDAGGLVELDVFADPDAEAAVASFVMQGPRAVDHAGAGDLWVRVRPLGATPLGYAVTIQTAPLPPCEDDAYEPNGTAFDAGAAELLGPGGEVAFPDGRLCGGDDVELFRVAVQAGVTAVRVELDRDSVLDRIDAGDTDVTDDWIGEQGVVLSFLDGALQPIREARGRGERLFVSADGLAPGLYWVRVTADAPRIDGARPWYDLTVRDATDDCSDAYEPNDARADAAALPALVDGRGGAEGARLCGRDDDQDWYAQELDAAARVTARVELYGLGELAAEVSSPDLSNTAAFVRAPCPPGVDAQACYEVTFETDAAGAWLFRVQRAGFLARDVDYALRILSP